MLIKLKNFWLKKVIFNTWQMKVKFIDLILETTNKEVIKMANYSAICEYCGTGLSYRSLESYNIGKIRGIFIRSV